jgi:hypothetical protein
VNIFTKRNALVGYVVLKNHSRARRRFVRRQKRRSGLKLVTLLVLGILSVGILVAFAGVLHRRQRDGNGLDELDVSDELGRVADDLAGSTEPIPAT